MIIAIGTKDSKEYKWNGRIDEVRISKIARDPKELSPNLSGPQTVTSIGNLSTTWGHVKSDF